MFISRTDAQFNRNHNSNPPPPPQARARALFAPGLFGYVVKPTALTHTQWRAETAAGWKTSRLTNGETRTKVEELIPVLVLGSNGLCSNKARSFYLKEIWDKYNCQQQCSRCLRQFFNNLCFFWFSFPDIKWHSIVKSKVQNVYDNSLIIFVSFDFHSTT
jgi:hypothetical protein